VVLVKLLSEEMLQVLLHSFFQQFRVRLEYLLFQAVLFKSWRRISEFLAGEIRGLEGEGARSQALSDHGRSTVVFESLDIWRLNDLLLILEGEHCLAVGYN
jgi:hypothetical protein